MGTLFPDGPEYPKFKGLPSAKKEIASAGGYTLAVGFLTLSPLCPVLGSMLPQDEAPRPDFTSRIHVTTPQASGSTSTSTNIEIEVPAGSFAPTVVVGPSILGRNASRSPEIEKVV